MSYRTNKLTLKPTRKDAQQAPKALIDSYKEAYLRANGHEAPPVRYSFGRYYVTGTTGTGMTSDQFSKLAFRLQSRAASSSPRGKPSAAR